ncbi:DUF4386 domain-containing protein, partial [Listeria monocytogenes]|uniref:DUF4386 domain-containing protein n=1 Tax=Listeria monocytogenes TaxID=1639 RepID=UPI0011408D69
VVESENLLRSGIVSDVVIFLTEIAMAVVLYMLFRAVSKPLALIAMLSRVAQANVMALNVLCYLAILVLVGDQADLSAIANGERDSLVMALFTTHEYGVHVGQLFFGFSLVFLGLLAY